MKDYLLQKRRDRSIVLPQNVYRQALYAIKDLPRLKRKLAEVKVKAYSIPAVSLDHRTGMGNFAVSDFTGNQAIVIANLEARIGSIERAFDEVPEKYRYGIMNKLVYDIPYDTEFCCLNTWKKWQQLVVFNAAVNLHIL